MADEDTKRAVPPTDGGNRIEEEARVNRESQALLLAGHAEWAGDLERATLLLRDAAGAAAADVRDTVRLETEETLRDAGRSDSPWRSTDFLRLAAARRYERVAHEALRARASGRRPQSAGDSMSATLGQASNVDATIADQPVDDFGAQVPVLIADAQVRGTVQRLSVFEFETRAYAVTEPSGAALVVGGLRVARARATRPPTDESPLGFPSELYPSSVEIILTDDRMVHAVTVTLPGLVCIHTIWSSPADPNLADVADSSTLFLLDLVRGA